MCIGRCGGAGCSIYAGDELIGGDRGAVAFDDFDQGAGRRGRHLQHDLIGFNFDQDFIGLNGFARLFLPLQQRGFGDGFRKLGHLDFDDCHFGYSVGG